MAFQKKKKLYLHAPRTNAGSWSNRDEPFGRWPAWNRQNGKAKAVLTSLLPWREHASLNMESSQMHSILYTKATFPLLFLHKLEEWMSSTSFFSLLSGTTKKEAEKKKKEP